MPSHFLRGQALVAAMVFAVPGCGGGEVKVPCAGTVLVDGQPLDHGMLGIAHERGSVPAFVPVAQGRFATRLPPGRYDVHAFRAVDVAAQAAAPAPATADGPPRPAATWREIDQSATPFTLGAEGSSAIEFRMTTR